MDEAIRVESKARGVVAAIPPQTARGEVGKCAQKYPPKRSADEVPNAGKEFGRSEEPRATALRRQSRRKESSSRKQAHVVTNYREMRRKNYGGEQRFGHHEKSL